MKSFIRSRERVEGYQEEGFNRQQRVNFIHNDRVNFHEKEYILAYFSLKESP